MAVMQTTEWGITARQFRHPAIPNSHLTINSEYDNKQVKINARDYVQASGDSIALIVQPNQAATTTGEVYGAQIKPRLAAGFDGNTVNSVELDAEVKSGAGNLSSDLRNINSYLGATGTGTITGNVVAIRARAEVNATVSGKIAFAHIVNHEGSKSWDASFLFTEALGTHSMTTSSDKTANAKSGTIKVVANGTLYHIQLYADS